MKEYKYHLQLEKIEEAGHVQASVEIGFENHDDIFRIIEFMKESGRFRDEQEATQFAIGLKLFSGVMMKNRGTELFKDFEPAFASFMKKLKGR
ncbi:MAG: DUF3861 domain-containing protein [Bacteroidales bacterium]|nr:DUF3861 domain-containing protein [Bacteroidales bacterium]